MSLEHTFKPVCYAGLVMWRAVQLGQSFHLQNSPLFLVLLVFTMLERLTSFASDVAIERDWLTKLVGKSPPPCIAKMAPFAFRTAEKQLYASSVTATDMQC